jgi:hypothetical protein
MKNKFRLFLWKALLAGTLFVSCAGAPSSGGAAQQTPPPASPPASLPPPAPPRWVTDKNAADPDSQWLCVVADALEKKAAENAAMSALAQVFRVDLKVVSSANQRLAQMMSVAEGKERAVTQQSLEFAQELVSASNVSGLIGVQMESWTAENGTVYANARMNRRECAARYAAIIGENEQIIGQLKKDAAAQAATFEAYQMLNFAATVAAATDNLRLLLSVLDPQASSRRAEYGNAEAVKALAQDAARAIIITVNVAGDEGGRLAKAFGEVFASRGFRTAGTAGSPYLLSADFSMEDVDAGNLETKFVRYVLNCSLKNKAGAELISHSENDREGHRNLSEARQRAVRTTEASIGKSGEGFAAKFDDYLASLL